MTQNNSRLSHRIPDDPLTGPSGQNPPAITIKKPTQHGVHRPLQSTLGGPCEGSDDDFIKIITDADPSLE